MTIDSLVASWGYLAVLGGTLLEGETLLVMAGFAARQGHLSLPLVIAIAFVGGTFGDQFFFWSGRRWGRRLLNRFPGAAERADRVERALRRHDAWLVVGIRFMYGLRIVGPLTMGAVGLRPVRFAVFNVIGAALWATLVALAGYAFGHAMQRLLGNIGEVQEALLLAALLVGGVGLSVVGWRLQRHR